AVTLGPRRRVAAGTFLIENTIAQLLRQPDIGSRACHPHLQRAEPSEWHVAVAGNGSWAVEHDGSAMARAPAAWRDPVSMRRLKLYDNGNRAYASGLRSERRRRLHGRERRCQPFAVERLGQQSIHAGGEAAFAVLC